jgi:predicted DsbA family dithiol-disulfide isomerase
MKIEIWSDVMCPFCYIGKRRFEAALNKFAHKDEVEIRWRSFQLNPDLKTNPEININQYLADIKGISLGQAEQMNAQVTAMAAELGLEYNFDKAVVANSFNAHRLSHLANQHGVGDAAEEALFRAYFTEGKNIDDIETLVEIGTKIGLHDDEIKQVLQSGAFADKVAYDINVAQQLGIRGVPFFVLDNKYAVSGAQMPDTFLGAIEQAYTEMNVVKPLATDGDVCGPEGNC